MGDASGIQSPLSFGGFGSITRHLERISAGLSQNHHIFHLFPLIFGVFLGLEEALNLNLLNKESLALINPYQVFSPKNLILFTLRLQVELTLSPSQI